MPAEAEAGAPLSERHYTHGEIAPPPSFSLSLSQPRPETGQLEMCIRDSNKAEQDAVNAFRLG